MAVIPALVTVRASLLAFGAIQGHIPICAGNFLPRRGILTCVGGAMGWLAIAMRMGGGGVELRSFGFAELRYAWRRRAESPTNKQYTQRTTTPRQPNSLATWNSARRKRSDISLPSWRHRWKHVSPRCATACSYSIRPSTYWTTASVTFPDWQKCSRRHEYAYMPPGPTLDVQATDMSRSTLSSFPSRTFRPRKQVSSPKSAQKSTIYLSA